jgi:glycerol-3-phosphate O-acyltransferase
MQEIKKKKKPENPNEIYNYIQSLIEIYIEENQDFPNKTINKLIKILNYINLIFENEETEDENIKIIENLQSTISSLKIELERYKNKIEILLKENERMIKEEKELHPYQLLLNQKLKSKDDKYRLMEQKYL